MTDIEHHLKEGLKNGYNQNQVLHTSYFDNETSIVEYLLTVNVAQKLIEWNSEKSYSYSLYLEYPTEKFFKNAFLPYMEVGDGIFDIDIIHPEVTKSIKDNDDIRTGRIDLVVCKEKLGFTGFKESLIGIELKGLNPSLDKVVEDIERLVLSIEMKDGKFENSIQAGYCLHIKKLGGDKRLSTEKTLESAMQKSIENLENVIKAKVKTTTTKIAVLSEVVSKMTCEEFAQQANQKDLTADEVAEGTKIVFSVMIKITRNNTGDNSGLA
jgi:hypothetical protein